MTKGKRHGLAVVLIGLANQLLVPSLLLLSIHLFLRARGTVWPYLDWSGQSAPRDFSILSLFERRKRRSLAVVSIGLANHPLSKVSPSRLSTFSLGQEVRSGRILTGLASQP